MRSCRGVLFYKRQFAAEIIVTCVRWYLPFSLSLRDVEELMVTLTPATRNLLSRPHQSSGLVEPGRVYT